jgi:hypothetical protein
VAEREREPLISPLKAAPCVVPTPGPHQSCAGCCSAAREPWWVCQALVVYHQSSGWFIMNWKSYDLWKMTGGAPMT